MKKSTPTSFGYVKVQVEMAVKPKFLRGSVLGEMMDSPIVRVALLVFCSCAFIPMSINSVLESLIMSLSLIIQLRMSQRHASNGGILIGIIVCIECQIGTGIIGVTVRCWQVLANYIKKLTSVNGEQHWAEIGALWHTKLQIKTV